MIIYALSCDLDEFEKGTKFTFNHSLQRFETLDHHRFLSNKKSASHPGYIIIYQIIKRAARKYKVFNIPF